MHAGEFWGSITRWASANAPAIVPHIPPGVSPLALARAESVLEFEIPVELKEFLLVHDGSGDICLHKLGVFMSLKMIMTCWDNEFDLWGDGQNDEWAKPDGPIQAKWFTRVWLPAIDTRCGDYSCIDLDPAINGREGQIITWYHNAGPARVVAPSFGDLLAEFIEELEAGAYIAMVNEHGWPYLHYTKRP